MKKRLLSLALTLTMAASLLACGSKEDTESVGDGDIYEAVMPTDVESSSIYVQKIDGLSDDFVKGMDVSSVLSEEAAGVVYYNEDGEEEDVFQILADAGVNYARIRVWNDPFDSEGEGYGGGNCNLDTAVELGKRATAYGMKTCVDFHYSDFWADPNKQMAPKAWEDMSLDEKKTAIYDYTYESVTTLLDAGVNLGMVQIGNEINYGLAGESDFDNELTLLVQASKAVRAASQEKEADVKIVCHFTQVDAPDQILETAGRLQDAGVDYDIFGVSYYTYWHGTFDNLIEVLQNIKSQYGVDTCIMETSYLYTDVDADQSANSIGADDALENYPISVQGQANNLRDVMAAASEAGALGVFYWEGCWIAASDNYDANSDLYAETGCGWASAAARYYDANDAGKYYGGCSWDNQALFDASGKALASLNTFKYVNYGATGSEVEVIAVPNVSIEVKKGSTEALPDTVTAIYNDSSVTDPVSVTWDSAIDTSTCGTYEITGTTADGFAVTATVKVVSDSYVVNGSFEDADTSMWTIISNTGETPVDYQNKAADAYDGDISLHWWSESDQDFYAQQYVTDLPEGTYMFSAYLQGGDVGSDAEIYLCATVYDADGLPATTKSSEPVALTGWQVWENPTVTDIEVPEGGSVQLLIIIRCAGGGWGTCDQVELVVQ